MLLITKKINNSAIGGREQLCKLNRDILQEIFGDQLIIFELEKSPGDRLMERLNSLRGFIDGLSPRVVTQLMMKIENENATQVFIDGSNLGECARAIHINFPELQIFTFFHNVESRFFLGLLKQNKTIRSFAVFIANYLAERKAVKFSSEIICLNSRDSQLLKKTYGRSATHLSPMALADRLPAMQESRSTHNRETYALFVGGAFYANKAGIVWFVKYVMPHVSMNLKIIGKGMITMKSELEADSKVEVIGEVEDLSQWYADSALVVAPIFDGSGMKTKVAEALMYGKKILGTPEAFSGYEDIAKDVGRICKSDKDFIIAINSTDNFAEHSFEQKSRDIYLDRYSYRAAKIRLDSLLS